MLPVEYQLVLNGLRSSPVARSCEYSNERFWVHRR
jgi:hypothetical protein